MRPYSKTLYVTLFAASLFLAFGVAGLYQSMHTPPPDVGRGDMATLLFAPELAMAGEQILTVEVYQWTGAAYTLRGQVTSSGGTIQVEEDQKVRFYIYVLVGYDPAFSEAQALTYTRVYFAMAGEVSSTLMDGGTVTTVYPDVAYEVRYEYVWDDSPKPEAGETYSCTFTYQVYM